jgi:hypothetical protein
VGAEEEARGQSNEGGGVHIDWWTGFSCELGEL